MSWRMYSCHGSLRNSTVRKRKSRTVKNGNWIVNYKQQGRINRPVALSQLNLRHTLHMRRMRKHIDRLDFDRFVTAVF